MTTSSDINEILSKVKKLQREDQLHLLQRLMLLLQKTEETKSSFFPLSSLSGLGSEVWKHTDIDKYIDEERQW